MVQQHVVKYHEARDWIRQQDQSQLTYRALLSHFKMLEAHCKQYQKAKERGHADLASITAATSSLHIAFPGQNLAAKSVGTPIQMVNVQLKVNSAMHVEAITTTLCCASKRDAGKTSNKEALSPASATTAVDVIPATPHIGTASDVIALLAIPGPHPTAPHIVLPMVHPLGAPHIPKGTLYPTDTTRCYRCHTSRQHHYWQPS